MTESTLAARPPQIAADDDKIDRPYHGIFDEVITLMRADPANS